MRGLLFKTFIFVSNFAIMFDFDQYLGFILFLTILTIGFWLLIFLTAILPYWIGGSLIERLKENKKRKQEQEQESA